MIDSSAVPEPIAVSTQSRCCDVSGVSSSNCVIPITPLSGVRISWLMLARNSLFAVAAASAFARACSSDSRICLSLVMSSVAPISRHGSPSRYSGRAWMRRHLVVPSCARIGSSI